MTASLNSFGRLGGEGGETRRGPFGPLPTLDHAHARSAHGPRLHPGVFSSGTSSVFSAHVRVSTQLDPDVCPAGAPARRTTLRRRGPAGAGQPRPAQRDVG